MAISELSLLLFVQNISYEHDNDIKVQMKQSFTKKWLHMKTDFTTEAKDNSEKPINLGSSRFYLGQQQCSRWGLQDKSSYKCCKSKDKYF